MLNVLRLKLLIFSAMKYKLSSEGKNTDHSLFTSLSSNNSWVILFPWKLQSTLSTKHPVWFCHAL